MNSVNKQYAKELAQAAKLERELKASQERAKTLRRAADALKRKEEKERQNRYALALGQEIGHIFYPEDPSVIKTKLEALKAEGRL